MRLSAPGGAWQTRRHLARQLSLTTVVVAIASTLVAAVTLFGLCACRSMR